MVGDSLVVKPACRATQEPREGELPEDEGAGKAGKTVLEAGSLYSLFRVGSAP